MGRARERPAGESQEVLSRISVVRRILGRMKRRHLVAAATVAALGAGAAGAVAAGNSDKAAENAVLADAAKKLGVSASALRGALSQAEDSQLDAQVKAGMLTQAQADAIEQHRRQEGTVLDL